MYGWAPRWSVWTTTDGGVVVVAGKQELRGGEEKGERVKGKSQSQAKRVAGPGRECFDRDGVDWSSANRCLALLGKRKEKESGKDGHRLPAAFAQLEACCYSSAWNGQRRESVTQIWHIYI